MTHVYPLGHLLRPDDTNTVRISIESSLIPLQTKDLKVRNERKISSARLGQTKRMAKAESDLYENNMENPRLDRCILIPRPLSVQGRGRGPTKSPKTKIKSQSGSLL